MPLPLLRVHLSRSAFIVASSAPTGAMTLGALLVAARLSHGMGMMQDPEDYPFRVFGMMGTFSVMGIAAVAAFLGAVLRG